MSVEEPRRDPYSENTENQQRDDHSKNSVSRKQEQTKKDIICIIEKIKLISKFSCKQVFLHS